MENMTELLILGLPISTVAPLIVEQYKRVGLTDAWTGPASMATCLLLVMLVSAARGEFSTQSAALYILQGIVYGLAGNGVYSQAKLLAG